jgi:hypothetical protein
MTMGTQSKPKVIALAVLVAVMLYLVYTNLIAGPDIPTRPAQRAAAPAGGTPVPGATGSGVAAGPPPAKRAGTALRSQEFRPVLQDRNPTKRPDVTRIDPTLRLELFAKVQGVELTGGARNVFQFGAAPPPPQVAVVKPTTPEPVVRPFIGPRQPPPPAPPQPPPAPPPPPPITLKFYGFTAEQDGSRKAYLLDGEDIYIASEGDTLKRKYKVVRIGPTSILIEDLDAKRQQSVPLTPEESAG